MSCVCVCDCLCTGLSICRNVTEIGYWPAENLVLRMDKWTKNRNKIVQVQLAVVAAAVTKEIFMKKLRTADGKATVDESKRHLNWLRFVWNKSKWIVWMATLSANDDIDNDHSKLVIPMDNALLELASSEWVVCASDNRHRTFSSY